MTIRDLIPIIAKFVTCCLQVDRGVMMNLNAATLPLSLQFYVYVSLAKLHNARPLICMSLNKNSVFCILTRSSENAAKFKQ